MRHESKMITLLAILSVLAAACPAGEAVLLVRSAPPDGLVLIDVDLAPLMAAKPASGAAVNVEATLADKPVPIQAWADDRTWAGPQASIPGVILLKLPGGGDHRVTVRSDAARRSSGEATSSPASRNALAGALRTVRTPHLTVTHDPARFAGLPSRIEILQSAKTISDKNYRWDDRLHSRELGGRRLTARGTGILPVRPTGVPPVVQDRDGPATHGRDAHATPPVTLLSDGPLAVVVRVLAQYADAKPGSAPEATAVYDWFYFRDRPLVLVRVRTEKLNDRDWDEHHFLELTFSDKSFPRWAGGQPLQQAEFSGTNKGTTLPHWGALIDGRSAIALLRGGRPIVYDGLGGHGCYLLAHGEKAWAGWKADHGRSRAFDAWYWIGAADDPPAAIQKAAAGPLPSDAEGSLLDPHVAALLDNARKELEIVERHAKDPRPARLHAWKISMAERLAGRGLMPATPARVSELIDGGTLNGMDIVTSGDLALLTQEVKGPAGSFGIAVRSLYDLAHGVELLSDAPPPLFEITLRHGPTGRRVRLTADAGWRILRCMPRQPHLYSHDVMFPLGSVQDHLDLLFAQPQEPALKELVVQAGIRQTHAGLTWAMRIGNPYADWSLEETTFPQVALRATSDEMASLFPRGPGEVRRGVWKDEFQFKGRYPSGWTTMQFLACYDERRGTGLYVGMHDKDACTKEIRLQGRSPQGDVLLSFAHPLPTTRQEDTSVHVPGLGVLRLLRGDWYDAACIYRDWVNREAVWRGQPGRPDTPAWMRELPAWVCTGGAPANVVERMKAFQKWLGVPVGLHWYSWHRIPFDNDYPHYLPPREGFAQAVRELQRHNVRVMPYINGRLWDTRDKGIEDAEFTRTALPAATKDEKGKPFTEVYGSKEADGSPVRLAVMCPHTKLWQDKVKSIVLSLMNEHGVDGVYIDQVAAAAPVLCMDASHGHPLGGGCWWQQGYAKMLSELRAAMPAGKMLTTECNADPYVRWFDGYLTWHWQFDGQVPAFPAVYGGTLQMFGRAFRGGDSQDLAMRMKVGQQLVFGEQIGWSDVEQIRRLPSAEFFRDVVRLRWALREYFHQGHMGRPPRLTPAPPTVTADWHWSGVWPVSIEAVQTGAWAIRDHKGNARVVLFFANVSDAAYSGKLKLDLRKYGLEGVRSRVRVVRPAAPETASTKPSPPTEPADDFETPALLERTLTLPPKRAAAWEIVPVQP